MVSPAPPPPRKKQCRARVLPEVAELKVTSHNVAEKIVPERRNVLAALEAHWTWSMKKRKPQFNPEQRQLCNRNKPSHSFNHIITPSSRDRGQPMLRCCVRLKGLK
jgi:hypothetical protein